MKTSVIAQYDNDNNFLATYSSIALAASFTGTQPSHISKVAQGNRRTAGGYRWDYEGECVSLTNDIEQVDKKTGEVVAVYISVEVAAQMTSVRRSQINDVVTGFRRSAGGYFWRKVV